MMFLECLVLVLLFYFQYKTLCYVYMSSDKGRNHGERIKINIDNNNDIH